MIVYLSTVNGEAGYSYPAPASGGSSFSSGGHSGGSFGGGHSGGGGYQIVLSVNISQNIF